MIEDINIHLLQEIFQSEEYFNDLTALSSYATNIKQEGPMLHILAKIFDKKGYKVALEWDKKNKHDIMINNTIIEAKFYYEEDLLIKLGKEFDKANRDINKLRTELNEKIEKKENFSWRLALPILKDIFFKKPDIFILIILSRDLTKISPDNLKMINQNKECLKYNKNNDFNNQNILKIVIEFLNEIKKERNFIYNYSKINTNTKFRSTYHIYLCEFSE